MAAKSGSGYSARQVQLIAVCTICMTLSVTVVGLRLLVRRISSVANSWWDDWVTVLALVASLMVNIFTLVGIPSGLGKHNNEVDKSKATSFGVSVYIQQISWAISIGLTIISILLFYLRLFPNRWMKNTVYSVGIFTIAWLLASALTIIFQCTPVPFFWNEKISGGHCIDANPFYFAVGITSTVAMITVLFLPLPIILQLKTSTAKKLGLAGSFILGAFVCIASIVRLIVLFDIKRNDLTYTSSLPQLWSCVEASFGVISACVPSLTPLFLLLIHKTPTRMRQKRSFPYTHSNHKPNGGGGRGLNIAKANQFNRLGDSADGGGGPHAMSQSLELIILEEEQREQNSDSTTSATGVVESNIVVTSQLDQVTKERADDSSGAENWGVQAHAGVWDT